MFHRLLEFLHMDLDLDTAIDKYKLLNAGAGSNAWVLTEQQRCAGAPVVHWLKRKQAWSVGAKDPARARCCHGVARMQVPFCCTGVAGQETATDLC